MHEKKTLKNREMILGQLVNWGYTNEKNSELETIGELGKY